MTSEAYPRAIRGCPCDNQNTMAGKPSNNPVQVHEPLFLQCFRKQHTATAQLFRRGAFLLLSVVAYFLTSCRHPFKHLNLPSFNLREIIPAKPASRRNRPVSRFWRFLVCWYQIHNLRATWAELHAANGYRGSQH